jgi:hypothetical protein
MNTTRTAGGHTPVVSFADFLNETGTDDVSLKDENLSSQEPNITPMRTSHRLSIADT